MQKRNGECEWHGDLGWKKRVRGARDGERRILPLLFQSQNAKPRSVDANAAPNTANVERPKFNVKPTPIKTNQSRNRWQCPCQKPMPKAMPKAMLMLKANAKNE